jgi:hypothetical protein
MSFDLLKDSDKPLRDGGTNHSKLLFVVQVFIIKSDNGLSKTSNNIIVEWTGNILPEGNRLKKNFYVA